MPDTGASKKPKPSPKLTNIKYGSILDSVNINGSFKNDFFVYYKLGEILSELESMIPDKELLG